MTFQKLVQEAVRRVKQKPRHDTGPLIQAGSEVRALLNGGPTIGFEEAKTIVFSALLYHGKKNGFEGDFSSLVAMMLEPVATLETQHLLSSEQSAAA